MSTETSKKMSYALRHKPEDFNLDMSEDGSVELEHFCVNLGVKKEEVESIVSADKKGRYTIHKGRIWANQGHSIEVSVPLERVTLDTMDDPLLVLYHGTPEKNLTSIIEQGLVPGERRHVHLSTDEGTARTVGKRRKGDTLVFAMTVIGFLNDGHELWKSSNGVYLASAVPSHYLVIMATSRAQVERINTRKTSPKTQP